MVKPKFSEQYWHFWSLVSLRSTVDFLHYLHFEPFLVIRLYLLFYFQVSSLFLQVSKKIKLHMSTCDVSPNWSHDLSRNHMKSYVNSIF